MAHLVRFEKLSIELHNLENADVVLVAQAAVPLIRVEQTHLQEEASKKVEKQATLLGEMNASLQKSLEEYDLAALNAKGAEDTMCHAQEVIAKAQALLQANERILEQEKKKMAEMGARNFQMQNTIQAQSLSLEAAKVEQAEAQLLSDEELR